MANNFGSLYVGSSGLRSASNGINTTANNLSNVNTEGYVREQVVYEDLGYLKVGISSISSQYSGLGVQVGTIVHARDVFLDKAYRTENGRHSFYEASAEAVQEVETYLQESDGATFQSAIADFYEAFAEFAKDPSDTVNQNLVLQKASLFLSRASAVQQGFEDYQSIINSKIEEDVDRINEIGERIVELNTQIMTIEAAKKSGTTSVEQAMNLRDERDLLLDELSGLAKISYSEDANGIVKVEIESVEFVDEVRSHPIQLYKDKRTGFVTPYWSDLSSPSTDDYYKVFKTDNVSADKNTDIGEVKALILARGENWSSYLDFYSEDGDYLTSGTYENGIANSIMMNSEAELDTLIHQMVTTINDLFSPLTTISDAYSDASKITYTLNGENVEITDIANSNIKILDQENADVGTDGELPPRELFVRTGCTRYTTVNATVTKTNDDGTTTDEQVTLYLYNEEDTSDTAKCYTLKSLSINEDLVEQESLLPHISYSDPDEIDYTLGKNLEAMWTDQNFNLNPSDTTPCSFTEFYTKWVGEIGTIGSVYETTATSLETTSEQIEDSRQGVMGVSSDEELTNLIKYQSAYNAASRYINVINEMIEHLLTSLGS